MTQIKDNNAHPDIAVLQVMRRIRWPGAADTISEISEDLLQTWRVGETENFPKTDNRSSNVNLIS